MPELIQIDEKTRIRHMDSMNWTVESLRQVKKKDGTTADEWTLPKGANHGPFFHKPEHALSWLLENRHGGTPGALPLEDAIAEYRAIADRLAADVEKAMAEGGGDHDG